MRKDIKCLTDGLVRAMPKTKPSYGKVVNWPTDAIVGPVAAGLLSDIPRSGQICRCLLCPKVFRATEDAIIKFNLVTPITVTVCPDCKTDAP